MAYPWFTDDSDSGRASRLLETDSVLLAPDLMAVEVTNAWWKKLRRGGMDVTAIDRAITHLLALEIEWIAAATLLRPASRLAAELAHPVYDCVYLALATSRFAALATVDERLRQAAQRIGVRLWSPRG